MTGIPLVIFDVTLNDPPKIDWVVEISDETSMASVMMPLSRRTARRPPISFPRADDAIRIAAGFCDAASCAIASTAAPIPFFSNAESSMTNTFEIEVPETWFAIASPAPGDARTIP